MAAVAEPYSENVEKELDDNNTDSLALTLDETEPSDEADLFVLTDALGLAAGECDALALVEGETDCEIAAECETLAKPLLELERQRLQDAVADTDALAQEDAEAEGDTRADAEKEELRLAL